jgi:outer membrane lipoprotein-sorting protein
MRIWAIGLLISLCGAAACAQTATTQPTQLSAQSSADEVLDALDARGKSLQDFTATVKLTDTNDSVGDSTSNTGTVVLQKKSADDARIRVAFTRREADDKIFPVDRQFTLDSGQLVERDYQEKKETRRQVLKPGQKLDLFKLGEGPFPLPLGQPRQDVEKLFDVMKIDPVAGDPPGTVHLQLTPKPKSQFAGQFKTIDVWVDPKSAMPIQIQTVDPNVTTTKTTELKDIKINGGASDKDFAQPPLPDGWDVVDEPYEQ